MVTHVGPSVDGVCPAACTKALMSSSIDREREKGLEMEIEAEYIVSGMAFDIRPYFHPRLTLTVVEDTNSM